MELRQSVRLAAVFLGVCLAAVPPGAAAAEPVAPSGYTIPFTHMWDMPADDGQIYRIFVSYPGSGEPPALGYPVLYVLDGNAMFAAFAEARRIRGFGGRDLDKMIVVGIGGSRNMAISATASSSVSAIRPTISTTFAGSTT